VDGVKERTLVGDNVGVTEGNLDGNKSGNWKANTLLQSGLRTNRQTNSNCLDVELHVRFLGSTTIATIDSNPTYDATLRSS